MPEDPSAAQAAIITSLRRELDAERKAHAQSAQDAEATISSLEARLALRDAELEACIAHADHAVLFPPVTASARNEKPSMLRSSSFAMRDTSAIIDEALTVNAVLQNENKALIDEVRPSHFFSNK